MSGTILTVNPTKSSHVTLPAPASDMYAQMEATHAKIDPRNMQPDLTPTPLKNVPLHLQKAALSVMDEICEKTSQESMTRRLSRLMARVAEAAERHIFQKKDKQYEKKSTIEENIVKQQEWKNYQAWTQCGGGFGSAFLSFSGKLIGGSIGELLTGLTQLTPAAANSLSTWMEGHLLPLQHEQQFFLSTVSSDNQAIEALKNLPKEMQQLIQRLLDLEMQAYRAVSQR